MKQNKIILCLLLVTALPFANAETPNGTIRFDCPDMPDPKFQFHFTRELIRLAATTTAFNTVENIYVHVYDSPEPAFDKLVAHHSEVLKAENWHSIREDGTIRLYMLTENASQNQGADRTVIGVFVIVKSDGDLYLLNIVARISPQQVGELLASFGELGILVSELQSLGELTLPTLSAVEETGSPLPLPTLFRLAGNPATAQQQKDIKTFSMSAAIAYEESHVGHWIYRGHPIDRIQIRADTHDQVATVSEGLKNGSKDITELLDNLLASSDSADTARFMVRLEERSITINAGDKLDETQPSLLARSFRTREGYPIHEIVIRGSRYTEANAIRGVLETGPEEIEKAVEALPNAVSAFETVSLLIEETEARRTAIITIDEKLPAPRVYFDGTPLVGFNRVTGWELGGHIEAGRRIQMAHTTSFGASLPASFPRGSIEKDNSKFFGRIGYGFSHKQPYFRIGGTAVWGEPYSRHLGLTAQFHRATSIIAPELFSGYDDSATVLLRIFGVPDHQNYYLRRGFEVALQWKPVVPTHAFKLVLLAEAHDSLEKHTDWHLFNWRSKSVVRDNPMITPGQMRSATFKYDFYTRSLDLGWHNTVFVEHSNRSFGSDFDWTRFQAHFRYAYPIGRHQIRMRGVVGSATAPLPVQRQFVMGGIGTLNGYPLYAFAGDAGLLLNMEFIYELFSFNFLNISAALILDEGQVWDVSDSQSGFDPKGSIGLGLQLETDVDVFRFNVAKAFEADQGVQYNLMFFYSF